MVTMIYITLRLSLVIYLSSSDQEIAVLICRTYLPIVSHLYIDHKNFAKKLVNQSYIYHFRSSHYIALILIYKRHIR